MSGKSATGHLMITGGCGFIGSNFVRFLLRQRHDVKIINLDKLTYAGSKKNLADLEGDPRYTFVKGDIRDRELLDSLFRTYDIAGIIHFAAESHVDNSISGPEPFIQTNIEGTFRLLEAAREHWKPSLGTSTPQRFLHISTDEVFGSLGPTGYFNETSAYAPNSPYSASKASSDLLVRSYVKTYGLNAVITNCSNNYGPYQHREKFIPTVISAALSGLPIPIYGTGENVRDWLYVTDHCEALLTVFERAVPGAHYVIGGGNEYSNLELARHICKILDRICPADDGRSYEGQIQFVKDRPGHDHRYAVDCSLVQSELGWKPGKSFEESLKETVEWHTQKIKSA